MVYVMTQAELQRELDRCDREIAEMENQPPGAPAYLTTLGIEDWKREKLLVYDEANHPPDNPRD